MKIKSNKTLGILCSWNHNLSWYYCFQLENNWHYNILLFTDDITSDLKENAIIMPAMIITTIPIPPTAICDQKEGGIVRFNPGISNPLPRTMGAPPVNCNGFNSGWVSG